MNKILMLLTALSLSGCCAFTEIGKFDPVSDIRSNDGEKPVAVINVANVGYKLLGFIPLSSGNTWQGEEPYEDSLGLWNAGFGDHCSVDENLASIRAALKYLGRDRIGNLTVDEDAWSVWSLFIVRRKVVKTSCVVY